MSRGAQLAVDQINQGRRDRRPQLPILVEDLKSGDADAAVTGALMLLIAGVLEPVRR